MQLLIAIVCGFLFSFLLPQYNFLRIHSHETILYTLLAIGLYGAVYGIQLNEFNNHRHLILRAVTFGVLIKSLIIGIILFFIFQTPYAFLYGIIVAQIDPLSVAHLIGGKSQKFSESGRTILRAWSSFDDPITVLLALYVFLPLVVTTVVISSANYLFQIGLNLLFTAIFYLLYKIVKRNNFVSLILLLIAFFFAITFQLMLGIALIGLFIRPRIKFLPIVIQVTFIIAAIILGSLLIMDAQSIAFGIVLGIVAFLSQVIATLLVAPKLNRIDKLFLSIAQYNGITSIILALIISQWVNHIVSIIGFAVITINILYYGTNYLLERQIKSIDSNS